MSNFKTLFLALVATAAWSSSNAFVPTVTTTKNQKDYQLRPVSSSTLLQAEPGKTQPLYGKELEMPETFVRCGKCQTIYAITENDLGEKGRG